MFEILVLNDISCCFIPENWLRQCCSSCQESPQGGKHFEGDGFACISTSYWDVFWQFNFSPLLALGNIELTVSNLNIGVNAQTWQRFNLAGRCSKTWSTERWRVWQTCSSRENDRSLRVTSMMCRSSLWWSRVPQIVSWDIVSAPFSLSGAVGNNDPTSWENTILEAD